MTVPPSSLFFTMHKLKLLLLGDSSSGKTTLLQSYKNGKFSPASIVSLGPDFVIREIPVGNELTKCIIWDTPGTERGREIAKKFISGNTCGIAICFDINDQSSVDNISTFMTIVTSKAPPGVPVVFVGTKSEKSTPVVTQAAVEELARGYVTPERPHIPVLFVSSASGLGVKEMFEVLATQALGWRSLHPALEKSARAQKNSSTLGGCVCV